MSDVSFAGDLATTVNADGSSVIGIVGSPGILGDFWQHVCLRHAGGGHSQLLNCHY
jgi:hypothetical protein